MVAECGSIVTHPSEKLQFATGLTRGGADRGPHAVITIVEHQHETFAVARGFPLRDQRSEMR
jgi:hypothetical protein